MREHVRILGILNIVMGCLVAAIGIAAFVVLGTMGGVIAGWVQAGNYGDSAAAGPIVATIGLCIALFFLVLAAPSILGGWGLLHFKPWARILMIVISALHLFHVPLGTALGVYGLWVLLSAQTQPLFEKRTQALVAPPVSRPNPGL
jgi:hypothetical protein